MSSEPPKPPAESSQLPQESSASPEFPSDAIPPHARSEQAQQRIVTQITRTTQEQWSGPIPPPQVLEKLDQVIPGGAERVLKMAEKEQDHRIDMERQGLTASKEDARRGQFLGAGISAASIIGAVIAVGLSAPWQVPVALVGVPIAAIVRAIVNRRSNGRQQR